MTDLSPTIVVIGGPNGAGKSTVAPVIINRVFGGIEFVNADTLALGLSALHPERQAVAAARIMLRHIADLTAARHTFAFETTLVSRSFAPFLRRAAARGYSIHLFYLWVRSPEIAVRRVRSRVEAGGHDIPEPIIRRRYARSARNLFRLYLPTAHHWEVLDDSTWGRPTPVAAGVVGSTTIVQDTEAWRALENIRDDSKQQ